MKKFLAVFAVLAMVCISSIAFAVEVTVDGMISVRALNFQNLTFDKDVTSSAADQVEAQEKIRLDVKVKESNHQRGKLRIEKY